MTSKPFYRPARRIVVTGGPGAGKTAVLELARRQLCRHIEVLPEAASIVFAGGFPRRDTDAARRSAQRAIYWIQVELEAMALAYDELATILCDRGTLDGLAYWPSAHDAFFAELGTSAFEQLARYSAVVHLRVPEDPAAYRRSDIRRESHAQARAIDARLLEVWAAHPRRFVIDGSDDFMVKAGNAIEVLRGELAAHDCSASQP